MPASTAIGALALLLAAYFLAAIPIYISGVPKLIQMLQERHTNLWRELGEPKPRWVQTNFLTSTNIFWFVAGGGYLRGEAVRDIELRSLGNKLRWLMIAGMVAMVCITALLVIHSGRRFGGLS